MITWLRNALEVIGLQDETYEVTIHLFESYIREGMSGKNQDIRNNFDIYLVGITCAWIASKYFEVNPLSLRLVRNTLGHKRFSKEDISL